MDCLAMRTAQSHVRAFKSEGDEIMARHYEAEECCECESFLQLGIDAYQWLRRATEHIARHIAEGNVPANKDIDLASETLYRLWLPPVEVANKWIEIQHCRNYELGNLDAFRKCERDVRAIVAEFDRMKALADGIPSSEDLALIAADPSEWLSEPAWVK